MRAQVQRGCGRARARMRTRAERVHTDVYYVYCVHAYAAQERLATNDQRASSRAPHERDERSECVSKYPYAHPHCRQQPTVPHRTYRQGPRAAAKHETLAGYALHTMRCAQRSVPLVRRIWATLHAELSRSLSGHQCKSDAESAGHAGLNRSAQRQRDGLEGEQIVRHEAHELEKCDRPELHA